MARCPVHTDRTPSLSIKAATNGKVLVHCFAGCTQDEVIAALRDAGAWPQRSANVGATTGTPPAIDADGAADPHRGALAIWNAAQPAQNTLVERYLAARMLTLPVPGTLRFHPALRHPSGDRWPAMVALITRGDPAEPVAIHRTFLTRDGSGKAPVEPQKMMLGPCSEGAVRLARPDKLVMVGEGIESCLAAMQATGRAAWAALSTSGLRALALPLSIRDVIILADGDDPGEKAATAAARRWCSEGRSVRIARPPAGSDFNDLLGDAKREGRQA